ncbi:M20 family peptidase [Chryseolinea lacunae]|uniref:M20 family peptidase n=1 Tax=Chryseolinea lacunae TaxID=2801331 RepID=A0ABS1KQL8_9BACT|nr:M20 family peptidase [Chryseolinea lacunae]MBL0741765.1 M20 family peptidase [Chryseolinea lacunae]
MIKRGLLILLALLVILLAILFFNAFTFNSRQPAIAALPAPAVDPEAIQHFQEAIRFKTISFTDSALLDTAQFFGFQRFLQKTYPTAHAHLERELVKNYSLLYTWKGKNEKLKPIVMLAHQDVVPIEEASKSSWTVDPFAGEVKDGCVWGRGSTDNKINVISIFETIEKLTKENFQPERTVILALGHDEERGGSGAKTIAKLLAQRNISAEMVLDEGGIVTRNKVPGMLKPVALIGTAEKGYLSLLLTVEKNGGHSSMPEQETALDILAKAVVNIRQHPFPPNFAPATVGFMSHVGPEMPYPEKLIFANMWMFKSVVIGIYEKSAAGNAVVRTTVVPTIFNAGMKDNVVPTKVSATVNLRLLQGDTSDKVIAELKKIINDDRVSITMSTEFLNEASATSPEEGFGYQHVQETVKKTFPETVATPFLMIGATDSRFFGDVSTNIIKFSPMIDPIGFHGIDERVSLESFQQSLWFYEKFLRQ